VLREVERATGNLQQFTACCTDHRDATRIEHSVAELLAQRVYALALGYEDLNLHDALRADPLLAVLAGASDPTGASVAVRAMSARRWPASAQSPEDPRVGAQHDGALQEDHGRSRRGGSAIHRPVPAARASASQRSERERSPHSRSTSALPSTTRVSPCPSTHGNHHHLASSPT